MNANGSPATRAELAANIQRIDEHLAAIRADVAEIRRRLGDPGRWVGARLTGLFDRALPALLVGGTVFIAARLTG